MTVLKSREQYRKLKEEALRGWNTWNTRSMLSHVHLPDGFALNLCLKDDGKAAYLKEAYVGEKGEKDAVVFPREHAYDGSYTHLTLSWLGTEIDVASATDGDDLVLLVTPLRLPGRPVRLVIEASFLWNKPGAVFRTDDGFRAEGPQGQFTVFATAPAVPDPYAVTQTPFLVMGLEGETGISTGKPRSTEEIRRIIRNRSAEHEKKLEAYGDGKELYRAMQTCVAWDTIYEPSKDRLVTPVSRRWNRNWAGYVLFCWDNFFVSQLAVSESRAVAYSNLIEILSERTPDGFVPNFASALGASSLDRSQPPVGSAALWDLYTRRQEKWLVDLTYDALCGWNDWWFSHRQVEEGLFAWGSDPYTPRVGHHSEIDGINERFGAALESGLDNSPMYDDIPFDKDTHMLCLADVGLTGLVIMDLKALIALSEIEGNPERRELFQSRLAVCEKAIQRLWCEEDGFFYNKRTDTGEFSKRISPTNFYALYASTVTEEQCGRILAEHFYNPEEFWGEYVLPSIARNDPAYPEQEYWRGRIWAPMNFLVYGALKARHLDRAATDLAERSARLILKEWLEKGHVHENYCAETGEGCNRESSDAFYHWGGLLALIALRDRGIL
ncbi:MAG: hypothetical protein II781_04605 [Clostridia bacterium]|nr:hypothetical protein [Clostridia bacterium]